MFCGHCGFKNEDGAVFCGNCGERLESSAVNPIPKIEKSVREEPV
nr:zinc ribbon domain-containing protein [uncultured Oribacterium sp.]